MDTAEAAAHLTALELDVDQEGPAGAAAARGGLQLQREAVLQPGLPAQLLPPRRRLLAQLAHLASEVVHLRVAQGIELVQACGAGEGRLSGAGGRPAALGRPWPPWQPWPGYLCQ